MLFKWHLHHVLLSVTCPKTQRKVLEEELKNQYKVDLVDVVPHQSGHKADGQDLPVVESFIWQH